MAELKPTDDVVTLKELHEEVFGEEPEAEDPTHWQPLPKSDQK